MGVQSGYIRYSRVVVVLVVAEQERGGGGRWWMNRKRRWKEEGEGVGVRGLQM